MENDFISILFGLKSTVFLFLGETGDRDLLPVTCPLPSHWGGHEGRCPSPPHQLQPTLWAPAHLLGSSSHTGARPSQLSYRDKQGMFCLSPILEASRLWPFCGSRDLTGVGGWSSNSNENTNKVLWGSGLTFSLDMEKRGFPDSRKMCGRGL